MPRMTYPGPPAPQRLHPPVNYRAALAVANAIGVIKWLILVLQILGILGAVIVAMNLDASDGGGAVMLVVYVLVGLIGMCVTWVLFGWFEHMLRVLVAIADHTYRG